MVGVVAHGKQQLPVHKHGVRLGVRGGEGLALLPQVGVQGTQIIHGRGDNLPDRFLSAIRRQGRHSLIAADLIDDVPYKGAARKARRRLIGEFSRVLLAKGQQFFRGSRRLRHRGRIVDLHQLGLGIGGLVSLDGRPKVHGRFLPFPVHISGIVGQVLAEGPKEQAVFLGGGEVFPVDPDQVDAALIVFRRLIPGQLVQDHVDIHGHPFHGYIIGRLTVWRQGIVDPVVHQLVATPAVKGHIGAPGRLQHRLPVCIIHGCLLFGAAAQQPCA